MELHSLQGTALSSTSFDLVILFDKTDRDKAVMRASSWPPKDAMLARISGDGARPGSGLNQPIESFPGEWAGTHQGPEANQQGYVKGTK